MKRSSYQSNIAKKRKAFPTKMVLIGVRIESADGSELFTGIQPFVPDESAKDCLNRFLIHQPCNEMSPSFKFLYSATQDTSINMEPEDLLPPGACMLIVTWEALEWKDKDEEERLRNEQFLEYLEKEEKIQQEKKRSRRQI